MKPTSKTGAFAALRERLSTRAPTYIKVAGALQTSVALMLTPGPSGLEVLFIRRAERAGDPWSGHIALPGGRREPADADLLATAIRETREEVGVALTPALLLGGLDDLHPRTPSAPPLLIRPFVFGLAERPAARLSDEVAGVMWFSLPEIAASAGTAAVAIRGVSTVVDCFRPGGTVVWGLTHRILRTLLPLV